MSSPDNGGIVTVVSAFMLACVGDVPESASFPEKTIKFNVL
jgi:hypothetical protein